MRKATIKRETKETNISVTVNIDGRGESEIQTPVGFFTHMLETFARMSLINVDISAKGDIEVDQHHSIEDCGIVLAQAIKKALGDKCGINRTGYFVYPMDDALAVVSVDIAGRPYLIFDAKFEYQKIGEFDTCLVKEFFQAVANNLGANIAIKMPYGENDHHKIEAIFKAFGKAMKMACSTDPKIGVPSTKGVLE